MTITEQQLPYKVRRHDVPKIVYGKTKDSNLVGQYNREKHTLYLYPQNADRKNPIELVKQHEIAHYQLDERQDPRSMTVYRYVEDELKADLLVYARIRKPAGYYDGIIAMAAEQLRDRLKYWKVSWDTKRLLVLVVIYRVINKYRKHLPEQWLKDYERFRLRTEKDFGITENVLKSFPVNNIEFYERLDKTKMPVEPSRKVTTKASSIKGRAHRKQGKNNIASRVSQSR